MLGHEYVRCPCGKFFSYCLDEILLEKLRNHLKECDCRIEDFILLPFCLHMRFIFDNRLTGEA